MAEHEMVDEVEFEDFLRVDIRVGTVLRAKAFPEARKPALKLWIDFGADIGEKKTSAQIADNYDPQTLVGKQVLAVVNFPARQIGRFMSEVLTLGILDQNENVVLIEPGAPVPNGSRLH